MKPNKQSYAGAPVETSWRAVGARKNSVHTLPGHEPGSAQQKDHASHGLQVDEVVRLLEVEIHRGLDEAEVVRRRNKWGTNRITPRPGPSAWRRFFGQFHQPLVYLLLVAVGVTALLGEWVDSCVIFGVVLINAIIGFFQEAKAANAIESLSQMVKTWATVRREAAVSIA